MHRHFRYERVYLPLCKVADTPFYFQSDDRYTPPPVMDILSVRDIYAQIVAFVLNGRIFHFAKIQIPPFNIELHT